MTDPNCIFCKIGKKEINPERTVWENEDFLAFVDLRPVKDGHLLIIPKDHTDHIFDLDDEKYSEIFQIAKQLSVPLQKAMGSKRVGIVVEGFGIAHCHVHLVPIDKGGELDSKNAHEKDSEELRRVAEKIREAII